MKPVKMTLNSKNRKTKKLVFQKNKGRKCRLKQIRFEHNNDHTRLTHKIHFEGPLNKKVV